MLHRFLESADAAQVLELMREAELSALQITEELPWAEDHSRWSVVLVRPPARLIFRRHTGPGQVDLTPADCPRGLIDELTRRLERETLWRRVRQQLEGQPPRLP